MNEQNYQMLRQIIRADEGPEAKTDEILYHLKSYQEKMSFLSYAIAEYKFGNVGRMLKDRWNSEDIPDMIYEKAQSSRYSPADLFREHWYSFCTQIDLLFQKTIPLRLRKIEAEVDNITRRNKATLHLGVVDECTDPKIKKLTTVEIAKDLKVTVRTVHDYVKKGLLKPCKTGGKLNYFPETQKENIFRYREELERARIKNKKLE